MASSKRLLQTAACLIIGDEVLNGKIVDTNSAYFATYCFGLGIDLKRIEVIADDESEIIEACRRMSSKYDFVVTSGGIGPTHDDITYPSIAKAFDLPLKIHDETVERMKKMSIPKPSSPVVPWDVPSPALTARLRMAELPFGTGVSVLFVSPDLWVPVCVVNENIHILPGVPLLFTSLLDHLRLKLLEDKKIDPANQKIHRILISTPLQESNVAPFLTELQSRVDAKGIKVGSYPRWGKNRNTITLVGRDKDYLESLVEEVTKKVGGLRVEVEGEDDVELKAEKLEEARDAIEKEVASDNGEKTS